jgi:hypothetical protein
MGIRIYTTKPVEGEENENLSSRKKEMSEVRNSDK